MSVSVPDVAPIPADGYVPVTKFGAAAIAAAQPWLTLHLAWYLDAIGAMFEPVYELVMDQGVDGDANYVPGYGTLLNPQTCPAEDLGYLGNFVGVEIPVGADEATARSFVTAESGLQRGTPAAVIAAAKRNLTGTQSVFYIERKYVDGSPNAGWFGLVVRPEELPDVQAFTDAVNAVKFGGLMWWLTQSDGFTWNAATGTWDTDTMSWDQTAYIAP